MNLSKLTFPENFSDIFTHKKSCSKKIWTSDLSLDGSISELLSNEDYGSLVIFQYSREDFEAIYYMRQFNENYEMFGKLRDGTYILYFTKPASIPVLPDLPELDLYYIDLNLKIAYAKDIDVIFKRIGEHLTIWKNPGQYKSNLQELLLGNEIYKGHLLYANYRNIGQMPGVHQETVDGKIRFSEVDICQLITELVFDGHFDKLKYRPLTSTHDMSWKAVEKLPYDLNEIQYINPMWYQYIYNVQKARQEKTAGDVDIARIHEISQQLLGKDTSAPYFELIFKGFKDKYYININSDTPKILDPNFLAKL